MPDNAIIVTDIAGNSIKIRVSGRNLVDKMKLIGFLITNQLMTLAVSDDQEKQRIIKKLINENALFLYGHGWYPSEVMAYYKDQKIDFGECKIIYWTDKDTYHIEER
jgi:hypothetical protein